MDHVSASPDGPGPYGGTGPGDSAGPVHPGGDGDGAPRSSDPGGPTDVDTLDGLREMWEHLDPVPAGLADRVAFALEVEGLVAAADDLDLELMRLVQEQPALAGSRGEAVRTITFGSESLTVMLALGDVAGGFRVDGWVAPGGRRRIEARTADGSTEVLCDSTGRFSLPLVPPGHFQLVLQGGRTPRRTGRTTRRGRAPAPGRGVPGGRS